MASVNKVILVGSLGRDPEVRYTPSGSAICNVTIATSRWKDKDQRRTPGRNQWHRVVFYDRLAEIAGEYLKGRGVRGGRLKTTQVDRQGRRTPPRSWRRMMQLLGGREGGGAAAAATTWAAGWAAAAPPPPPRRRASRREVVEHRLRRHGRRHPVLPAGAALPRSACGGQGVRYGNGYIGIDDFNAGPHVETLPSQRGPAGPAGRGRGAVRQPASGPAAGVSAPARRPGMEHGTRARVPAWARAWAPALRSQPWRHGAAASAPGSPRAGRS